MKKYILSVGMIFVIGLQYHSYAANGTWQNDGDSANWTDGSNWSSGAAPGGSDTATFNTAVGEDEFGGTPENPIIIDSDSVTLLKLEFVDNSGSYTIGTTDGNPIHFSAGFERGIWFTPSTNGTTVTINAPLVITDNTGKAAGIGRSSANNDSKLILEGSISGGDGGVSEVSFWGTNKNGKVNGVIQNGINDNVLSVNIYQAGVWEFTAKNTYSGTTSFGKGTLIISSADNLGDGSEGNEINFYYNKSTGGTLKIDAAGEIIDLGENRKIHLMNESIIDSNAKKLILSGDIDMYPEGESGTVDYGILSLKGTGDIHITGDISGDAVSFSSSNTGVVTVSGTNTYKGTTTVSAGTLIVNGSIAADSSVTINNKATLGGSGTISGNVTLKSGATLSPGNSPGLLTVGSLTLENGSATKFEINGLTRGTTYDAIDILSGGNIQFAGAFTIDFDATFSSGAVLSLFSFDTVSTGQFSSMISTGEYAGSWTRSGSDWLFDGDNISFVFSETTGNLFITIPEPSTWALFGIAVGVWVIGLYRRRSIKL